MKKKIKEEYNNKLNEMRENENRLKKELKALKKQLLVSENKVKQLNANYRNMQSQQNFFHPNKNFQIHFHYFPKQNNN